MSTWQKAVDLTLTLPVVRSNLDPADANATAMTSTRHKKQQQHCSTGHRRKRSPRAEDYSYAAGPATTISKTASVTDVFLVRRSLPTVHRTLAPQAARANLERRSPAEWSPSAPPPPSLAVASRRTAADTHNRA